MPKRPDLIYLRLREYRDEETWQSRTASIDVATLELAYALGYTYQGVLELGRSVLRDRAARAAAADSDDESPGRSQSREIAARIQREAAQRLASG